MSIRYIGNHNPYFVSALPTSLSLNKMSIIGMMKSAIITTILVDGVMKAIKPVSSTSMPPMIHVRMDAEPATLAA